MSEPSARVKLQPNAELGRKVAALLAEDDSHQLGVCGKLRIPYATYKRWLAAEPRDEQHDLRDFQGIVFEALDAARVRDMEHGRVELERCETGKASPTVNMWKFAHENRFRRFYAADTDPTRLEHSGPNGGPIETANLSDAEIDRRLAEIAAKTATPADGDDEE